MLFIIQESRYMRGLVNNDASIKNLTNKGVDNIITDKPVTAREVIYSRDTSDTLINMIKYVFNQ